MSFNWSVIFAEGFADRMQDFVQRLGQDSWLLSTADQVLWPHSVRTSAIRHAWREALM